jgi:hypothetical protein
VSGACLYCVRLGRVWRASGACLVGVAWAEGVWNAPVASHAWLMCVGYVSGARLAREYLLFTSCLCLRCLRVCIVI